MAWSDVLSGNDPLYASRERALDLPSDIPPWLQHILKTTPDYPPGPKGPQYNPKDVPIVPGSPAGQLMYDPSLGRGDERLLASGDQIRARIGAVPQSAMSASNTKGGSMNGWTPAQQAIIDRINSGQQDYTFGPGSPNPTHEDLNTYVGGKYSPAGGFAVDRGVALAPKEYNMFSPEQRRYLGIMDVAPADQVGKVERYYSADSSSPSRGSFLAGVPQPVSGGGYAMGTGSNPAGMSTMADYGSAINRGQNVAAAGQMIGSLLQNLGKSQTQNQSNPLALMQNRPNSLASLAPVPFPQQNLMSQYYG